MEKKDRDSFMLQKSVEKTETREVDDSGYSEKQTDLDVEIHVGEWQDVANAKMGKQKPLDTKLFTTYQVISSRLSEQIGKYCSLITKNPVKAKELLICIEKLRMAQEVLIHHLVWEPKKEFKYSSIPRDVWELVK